MFTYLSFLPPMAIYVYYSMWLTCIVILAAIMALLIYPTYYKELALILGFTGLSQIIMAGFLYYPYHLFIFFPPQSVVGVFALASGVVVFIYGTLKRKT